MESLLAPTNSAIPQNDQTPPGFNRVKRHWTRGFLWITMILLIIDYPLCSSVSSAVAVFTMHGGTWLSIKNSKWMGASIVSFVVSLYALYMRQAAAFVDEDRAYELKMEMWIKHRGLEIVWGGILGLFLTLSVKQAMEAKGMAFKTSAVNNSKNKVQ
uniref:Uncharacterized protein n=1 Tax=Attheya septentrionalis TaxID=420275 RepID=A0A7S2UH73_9STRA|mmetsp:Transcript_22301/g.40232  ORF Transcript_22301/g.40232 Transcript_22301/m.40232 type:complete len:157 (+) Transcript_22301:353-823(+)|eukprot:CAMPEP_0198295062 /NCGR_PEP_ID=MMETSP1449-20131203/25632_1 /TAXON_ID=420275 /ORGANISM="Attheya septentrionalis, Strain CCMP2084" /LENGTH=156 /DNA_ID=CAMNT_0043995237 /DNA_START=302 /DNA_END=772 /DNA_ORIENTATION=+